jgi:hypothetical protein
MAKEPRRTDTLSIQKRLTVLIDADNTQPAIIDGLLAEIAKYGVASVKRIYGDWTRPDLKGWKKVLLEYDIQPVQQFRYTTGKNSTDSAMIIDAMELLYSNKFDGFCIVSSDSDFTRLASKIREAGVVVYGFGVSSTPKPFVSSCDRFIFTEILLGNGVKISSAKKGVKELKNDTKLVNLLRNTVDDSIDESGWAYLGIVGQNIVNKSSEFDPRNYGYKKLIELIKAIDIFDIDERVSDNAPGKSIYIRNKRKKGTNRGRLRQKSEKKQ